MGIVDINLACDYCGNRGYIEDPVAEQTIFCPFCKSPEANVEAENTILPDWVTSRWRSMPAQFRGPRFQVEPWLLVIHSGSMAEGVAEYLAKPGDGRYVSAHLAWSKGYQEFRQMVSLDRVAWHCGGSEFRGNHKLNYCSIGIELPGPWDKQRSQEEHEDVRESVIYLMESLPSLRVAVSHSSIRDGKLDPGPGFDHELALGGLGLELAQW